VDVQSLSRFFEAVYISDFGRVKLPSDLPEYRVTRSYLPDMRFKIGKRVASYYAHIDQIAEAEYMAGRDLTEAPSYLEWELSR
jgi:hypothetical protein